MEGIRASEEGLLQSMILLTLQQISGEMHGTHSSVLV